MLQQYIKLYEDYDNSILLIVDVQKSFSKFFTPTYLESLKKYCKNFSSVYQIWDNHIDGNDVDTDYLYSANPDVPINGDTYTFPNQKRLIEKRYTYKVDVDFFKNILDENTYKTAKEAEDNDTLKIGDMYETIKGTHIVYIGNNHMWFHCPFVLFKLLKSFIGKTVEIVGGSQYECETDVLVTAQAIGVNIKQNYKYIYSAQGSRI